MLALLAALALQFPVPEPPDTVYNVKIEEAVFSEIVDIFREAFPVEAGVCLYGVESTEDGEPFRHITEITRVIKMRADSATDVSLTPAGSNGCDHWSDFIGVAHSHPTVVNQHPHACTLSAPDIAMVLREEHKLGMVICPSGWGNVFWNRQPFPLSWFSWA